MLQIILILLQNAVQRQDPRCIYPLKHDLILWLCLWNKNMECIRKITPKLLSLGGHFSASLSNIDAFLCQYFLDMLDMLDTNLAPVATDLKYLWGRCKLTNPTSFLTVKVPIGSTLYDLIVIRDRPHFSYKSWKNWCVGLPFWRRFLRWFSLKRSDFICLH